ncbi:MAG: N-acetylneuraminate synthase [Candidatus Scalindua sediminis]|nr:N-acetylneuraminate synthase [Candidatus Scalindua sediminis]
MPNSIKIGNNVIGNCSPCFIIAEAGVNHNGDMEVAHKLIDAAAEANADAVKFQTFKTENLILDDIEKASYQKETTNAGESQTEMLKRLEIDKAFHVELFKYCEEKNILFLSTCYDEDSLNLLVELGVPAIKIASTDTTNLLFLEKVAKTKKPVILSTGMCSLSEIEQAYQCLKENGCKELALLKCTSNYPTDPKDVNLNAMVTMNNSFEAVIGFSDHTEGVGASPYAVAMGASIIEKHFTLDKRLEGPDHQASLSPDELLLWVKEIRKVEQMLGSSEILSTESEKEAKKALQKHLVSKIDLKKGDTVTRKSIAAKRTGGKGISALEFYNVLGATLTCDLSQDRPIEESHLEKRVK